MGGGGREGGGEREEGKVGGKVEGGGEEGVERDEMGKSCKGAPYLWSTEALHPARRVRTWEADT